MSFEKWYAENRESYSKRRRARYADDPDYAAKCRAASQKHREKRKCEGLVPTKRLRKSSDVRVRSGVVEGWSIGHLCERIGRGLTTVNTWTEKGLLPLTPLRGNGEARLYTDEMIDVVERAVSSRGRIAAEDSSFYEEIVDGWWEAGIDVPVD